MRDKKYYKEDLQTDIDWLDGYGINKKEAKDFITYLLKAKPTWKIK